jgi:hypothetical protein
MDDDIQKVLAASELHSRNSVIEAFHTFAENLRGDVDAGRIDNPMEVVNSMYRFIQDCFAASVHMAHVENIVDFEDAADAFRAIYNFPKEDADKAVEIVNSKYEDFVVSYQHFTGKKADA